MANVTVSMENVAKTTLWQSNESSYLNSVMVMASLSAYSVTEPLGLTLGVNAH